MRNKRGQISTEYLIIVAFVTFIVISVLGIATMYTTRVQDTVKFDEIEKSAKKIIYSAETTFYSGSPARSTAEVYFPIGINSITITENLILFNVSSSTGNNVLAFKSSVPIEGEISPTSGIKIIRIVAEQDKVRITGN